MTNEDRYNDFFRPIVDTLLAKHQIKVGRKTNVSSGRHFESSYGSHIRYEARLVQGNKARVALHIDSDSCDWNIQLVESLFQRREMIETALDLPLDWEQERNTRRRRIEITQPGSIDDDDDRLREIREWMIEHIVKFKEVFGPHLKELVGQ